MARLELRCRDLTPVLVPLGSARITAGRHPDCELPLDSPFAARRHLCVEPQGDGYVVLDLGSAGGIYVNDQRVTTAPLKDGDVIRLSGDVTITYRHENKKASGATPRPSL